MMTKQTSEVTEFPFYFRKMNGMLTHTWKEKPESYKNLWNKKETQRFKENK